MFNDQRSKKVIFVAHCVFNQNAKLDACAHYPGPIREAAEMLLAAEIGIVQLPCPELLCLGLDREVAPGTNPTVAAEDTRIAGRMKEAKAQSVCRAILDDTVRQIREYRKHGFEIAGLLGINGSPTCGVETTWAEDQELDGPGIFVKMLLEELDKNHIPLKLAGIKALDAKQAVLAVKDLLSPPRQ